MKTRLNLLGLLLFVVLPSAQSQEPFQKAPPGVEEALRARVSEYYTLFGQSKFRQAKALVTEESKDTFYTMKKARHMGFAINGVTFADDVKSAKVLVSLMMMPMMGSKPVPFPVSTQWRLVDGEWYTHIPEAKPGDVVKTPFGLKTVVERKYAPRVPVETEPRPNRKSVGRMFHIDRDVLAFPTSAAGPVTETISIENRSRGELTLRPLSKTIKGVDFELTPASIPPGEKAVLTFTYTPAVRQLRRRYGMQFVIEPIAQRFTVKLNFRDRESPYTDQVGVKYGEPVTITAGGRQSLDITELTPGRIYHVSARAKMLEGDSGDVYLAVDELNRYAAFTHGPFQPAAGEERTLAVDFLARGSTDTRVPVTERGPRGPTKMRIDRGYTDGNGTVHWSDVTITPRTVVQPAVANAGFEGPRLAPWILWGDVAARLTSDVVRTGNGSLELSRSVAVVLADVPGVNPGHAYEVSVWVRAAPGTQGLAHLDVHDGEDRRKQWTGKRKVSESAFERFSVDFVATETGNARVHLTYTGGPGRVYFDDVVVTEKSVPNGGFEAELLGPWEAYGDAETTVSDDVAAGGAYSLAQGGKPGGTSQQLEGLRPGGHYRITAWARSGPDTQGQALVRILREAGDNGQADEKSQDGPRKVSDAIFEPFSVDFAAVITSSTRREARTLPRAI